MTISRAMIVSQAVFALAVAATAASAVPAAASHGARPFWIGHVATHWHRERHDYDRYGERRREFRREARRDRRQNYGGGGDAFDQTDDGAPEATPSMWDAPMSVTFAPEVEAEASWSPGPKVIEIGRPVPPRRPLPVVIYGDTGL